MRKEAEICLWKNEERCSNMSTEELEMMRERNRANQQERREEARGNLSPEQAELKEIYHLNRLN